MASSSPTATRSDVVFCAPDAEITLRSSDGVDFNVHISILRLISHVFVDMLSIPQSPALEASKRPVVQMTEDTDTLRLLLSFCYPRSFIEEPSLYTLEDIKRTAVLAQKYDIDFLRERSESALVKLSALKPFAAYAVAWRFGYAAAVRAAARKTLDAPYALRACGSRTTPGSYEHTVEYDEVPGTAFIRLWRYHDAMLELGSIAYATKECPISWVGAETVRAQRLGNDEAEVCNCPRETIWFANHRDGGVSNVEQRRVHTWWRSYTQLVLLAFMQEYRPSLEHILDDQMLVAMNRAGGCLTCSLTACSVLPTTKEPLRNEIERRLDEVRLDVFC
ncbi:unnamed protein product [Peniophora sp. CBMAI 1063]|nr:unnamed protein product [Peniophora sp. CBMAI 1063]